jgi:electron-transferring-flavoprotein dehydrogenase
MSEEIEEIERESMPVDVLFVGAGPASLAGALRLAQLVEENADKFEEPPEIAIVEKGGEPGAHILSGAVMKPAAMDELWPGWRDEAPIGPEVGEEQVLRLSEKGGMALPIIPPPMKNHGNIILSASRLVRWMAEKAEEKMINIFPGFPAVDVLWDGDTVVGVQTGDQGIAADGSQKGNFEPGINLEAKITIFGEGVLGHCSRIVTKKLGLDEGKHPWQFETGVKEIIKVPKGKGKPGFVMHTMGWPLDNQTLGGTWIYGLDDEHFSVGLVVSLDYKDPSINPQYMLQKFKGHPKVAPLLEGGEVVEYGGKALTIGGWYSMQQAYFDGGMFIGESAQMMNGAALKGLHMAIKSGMLAAETAFEALVEGDVSSKVTSRYKARIDDSFIKKEMWGARNFHQNFDKGMLLGMIKNGFATFFGSVGQRAGHHDHEQMVPMAVATRGGTELTPEPKIEIPTWQPKLDAVYLSKTLHEEDQPCHLQVADYDLCKNRCTQEYGNPCTRFCPAQVYEMVEDAEHGGKKLQVNFSNCVHCKTCDIKDPYKNILWVPPEGGGGPGYRLT